jgi:hypothetical protein
MSERSRSSASRLVGAPLGAADGLGGGLLNGGVQPGVVDAEAFADRLTQGLADPLIKLLGQLFVQSRMARQRGAQAGDATRMLNQLAHGVFADVRRTVRRQGRHGHGLAPVDDLVRYGAGQLGPSRHGDLVLQRRLDQQADQVGVLQQGAGGDDRASDLDLVQRQHVDQGGRGPVDAGDSLGQGHADVPLGLSRQGQEDVAEQRADLGRRTCRLAKRGDLQQQPLAVFSRSTLRQGQKLGNGPVVPGVAGRLQLNDRHSGSPNRRRCLTITRGREDGVKQG